MENVNDDEKINKVSVGRCRSCLCAIWCEKKKRKMLGKRCKNVINNNDVVYKKV